MAPKSKCMRLTLAQDNSSSSMLGVSLPPKKRFVPRPPVQRSGDDSSSTFDGIEKTLRKKKSTTIESIIDMYGERPLPPVPRIPSSIYNFSKQSAAGSPVSPETPQTTVVAPTSPPSPLTPVQSRFVTDKNLKAAKHLSQMFEKKTTKAKKLPKKTTVMKIQSCSGGDANTLKEVAVTARPAESVKPIPFTEWKAPTYQEPRSPSKLSPPLAPSPPSQHSSSFDKTRSREPKRTADGSAASYFAVIHHTKSINLERDPYRILFSKQSSPAIFPMDTKKAEKPKLPFPIRTHSLPDGPPTSSRFSPISPDASDVDSLAGVAKTLKSRAKMTFLQTKTPKRPTFQQRMDSEVSNPSPKTSPPPSSRHFPLRHHSRNSVQQGLSDIYDILQNVSPVQRRLSVKPAEPRRKADPVTAHQRLLTREMRTPAIPLTEYQKYGKKALEEPKKIPYVRRMPRKRLSKPQLPPLSTKNEDFKFANGQSPATPLRSQSIRSKHLSRAFHHLQVQENHASMQDRRRAQRHSLPAATRQNTDDSSNSKKGKSMGQKLASTIPKITGRGRSASAMGLGRERRRVREMSSEDRRDLLRKRIVVMGDPTNVGVPF